MPDSCILLDYMLVLAEEARRPPARLSGEHGAQPAASRKGLYLSQTILLKLTERGLERKAAYEAVQRAAMKTWQGDSVAAGKSRRRAGRRRGAFRRTKSTQLCSLDIHFR